MSLSPPLVQRETMIWSGRDNGNRCLRYDLIGRFWLHLDQLTAFWGRLADRLPDFGAHLQRARFLVVGQRTET